MDYLIKAWNADTQVWETIVRTIVDLSSNTQPREELANDLVTYPIYAEEFGGAKGTEYLVCIHDEDDQPMQTQTQVAH